MKRRLTNICIIGHISIDKIKNNQIKKTSIGGPPCYSGLVCINEKSNVDAYTKIGYDFPQEYNSWLINNNIQNIGNNSKEKTTSFEINESNNKKILKLKSKCEKINLNNISFRKYDGILISPIVNEIEIKNNNIIEIMDQITMLDPQGYLRKFNNNGLCKLDKFNINLLPKTDIIKISEEESKMIDNSEYFLNRLKRISRKYNITIGTSNDNTVYFIVKNKIYIIKNIINIKIIDSIGLGDILNGVFLNSYIKNEDMLWSVSKGIACTSTSMGIGIEKLEKANNYDEFTDSIYNNIKEIR